MERYGSDIGSAGMAVNTGMAKAEMKMLLTRSKNEPVSCAIGLGENAGIGLLMLHRTKPGRAVEALLKEEVPAAKNTRWGTAFVDVDDNPKLVKLTLNKPVSGMARKLVKTLKGTGFTKVVILTEDGSPVDDYEEADEDALVGVIPAPPPLAAGPTPEQTAVQSAALARALATLVSGIAVAAGSDPARKATLDTLAREAAVNLKTGNPAYAANAIAQLKAALAAPPAPPAPLAAVSPEDKAAQTAALSRALAALVPGIAAAAGSDPARKATLDTLARDAAVNLKTGNPAYAANAIAQLKKALETPASTHVDPSQLAASRDTWTGLRAAIRTDLDGLRTALTAAYAETPFAKQVAAGFDAKANPLVARFDTTLSTTLDTLAAEPDPARRTAIQGTLRTLVQAHASFMDNDAFIADLDANPFVPLAIRAKATAALAAISKTLG